MDGILGTMVITSHATDTLVLPHRTMSGGVENNVAHGTTLLTDTATNTRIHHPERTIGDEDAVEECTDGMRFKPGRGANDDIGGLLAGQKLRCNAVESSAGGSDLAVDPLLGVELETREIDIGLGHLDTERGVDLHS